MIILKKTTTQSPPLRLSESRETGEENKRHTPSLSIRKKKGPASLLLCVQTLPIAAAAATSAAAAATTTAAVASRFGRLRAGDPPP
mmetsp:Transcript_23931/g.44736  ORF Transcript_23931/g.44736 Transcript_23931/m.44736 type:complete len:86 (-) Transcript_23931:4-261(-)